MLFRSNYFQKSNEKMYKDNKDEIEKQQLDVNNNFKYIISHSAIILFVLIVICLILFRKKIYLINLKTTLNMIK